jgi:hypothetical protein
MSLAAAGSFFTALPVASDHAQVPAEAGQGAACLETGISLPPSFCAVVFAGHPRQMVVAHAVRQHLGAAVIIRTIRRPKAGF